jgi:hypothetical protein
MQPDWIASLLSDSETEARMPPESEAPRKAEVIDARPYLAAAKGSFGYRPVRQGRWNVGAMPRGPGRRHLLPASRPVTASPRFCLRTGPSYAEHNWGETQVERRLAAILVADVVGFSRLLGRDEEGTFRRLVAHRREVIEPSVDAYCGRIVKHTGDGLLAEFTSTVNAVRCAIAIQRRVAERNSGVTASERIELRIGISLGGSSSMGTTFSVRAPSLRHGSRASPNPAASTCHGPPMIKSKARSRSFRMLWESSI